MKKVQGLERGMGIGGWLTNYKRFNVLPKDRRLVITVGDMEHFESYITENDIAYIASLGLDHVRLGFDQIVLEESPFVYREKITRILEELDEGDCGMILRAKGIVAAEDGRWLHFDYVPGEPDVRYGIASVTGRICVIGSSIDKDRIKELFEN